MKKIWGALLVGVLIISIGSNVLQYIGRVQTYNIEAVKYKDTLDNSIKIFDQIQQTPNTHLRSSLAYQVWYSPNNIAIEGGFLNLMATRSSTTQINPLERVGAELRYFTNSVWSKDRLRLPADGAIDNAVPSTDNLKNLRDVYTIYRKNFSDSVIMSRNADKQKQALMAAHKEIENQGLDKLIPSFPLNAGIS